MKHVAFTPALSFSDFTRTRIAMYNHETGTLTWFVPPSSLWPGKESLIANKDKTKQKTVDEVRHKLAWATKEAHFTLDFYVSGEVILYWLKIKGAALPARSFSSSEDLFLH